MRLNKQNSEPNTESCLVGAVACLALFIVGALTLDVGYPGTDLFHPLLLLPFSGVVYFLGKSFSLSIDNNFTQSPFRKTLSRKLETVKAFAGISTLIILTLFVGPAVAFFLSIWIGDAETQSGRIAISLSVLVLLLAVAYSLLKFQKSNHKD